MTERLLAGLAVVPFLLGAVAAPTDEQSVVTAFQDPEITESSGLVVEGDTVYTVNDSGDSGRVFAVSLRTGETVGETQWSAKPTDVEGLAPAGPGEVWVGDLGDNLERRASVQVARVPVGPRTSFARTVPYELVYPDGPHDAESLLADPNTGRLYVATKSVLGGTLYAAPAELDPAGANRLEPVGDVLALATDATFLPGGDRLVVRNYAVAEVHAFPSLEPLTTFSLPSQRQGEGIAVLPDGDLLLSSEGVNAELLRVAIPAPGSASPSTSTSAEPSPSPSYTTESREDRELPESTETQRASWPWFLTGLLGVGFIMVLARSLQRR